MKLMVISKRQNVTVLISNNDEILETFNKFLYLGCWIENNNNLDKEINIRIVLGKTEL